MGRDLEWLEIIARKHKTWVKIVTNLVGEFYAEDIVQEQSK